MSEVSASDAGWALLPSAFDAHELAELRAGVEAVAAHVVARVGGPVTVAADGHRLQTLPGDPPTSVHWEPEGHALRNLRPVSHLDPRLAAHHVDARLTGPAARLLGVPAVDPLTSKISFKRARIGSEFGWHTDHTFLAGFLGDGARDVVTAMVLLDDARAGNGALELLPGSHRGAQRPAVTVEAVAGSVVLFHSLVRHRSGPNRSDDDRRALLYLFQPAGRPALAETG